MCWQSERRSGMHKDGTTRKPDNRVLRGDYERKGLGKSRRLVVQHDGRRAGRLHALASVGGLWVCGLGIYGRSVRLFHLHCGGLRDTRGRESPASRGKAPIWPRKNSNHLSKSLLVSKLSKLTECTRALCLSGRRTRRPQYPPRPLRGSWRTLAYASALAPRAAPGGVCVGIRPGTQAAGGCMNA